jgi:hypothetical protein
MKFSYSKIECYKTCPALYKYKYLDKLYLNTTTSALFFGTAVGTVFQAICLQKKEDLTPNEKIELERGKKPYEYLDRLLKNVSINFKPWEPYHHNIEYYFADYDELLLTDEDYAIIDQFALSRKLVTDGNVPTFDSLKDFYKMKKLTIDEKEFMNLHFFLCLKKKGAMMIDSFLKEVFPNIMKVHFIEKPIKIDVSPSDKPNSDVLEGFLDMMVDYKVTDEKLAESSGIPIGSVVPVLFDNKTSSTRYSAKDLTTSEQLSLYDYCNNVGNVGYIVAVKEIKRPKIGKRKGECYADLQVMIGKSDKELQERVLDEVCEVIDKVYKNDFPMSGDCDRIYGKQCDYYNFCKYGKTEGLTKGKT